MTQSNWSLSSHARSFKRVETGGIENTKLFFARATFGIALRGGSTLALERGSITRGRCEGALEKEEDFRIFDPSSVDKATNSNAFAARRRKWIINKEYIFRQVNFPFYRMIKRISKSSSFVGRVYWN